jgi:hypothetical protein
MIIKQHQMSQMALLQTMVFVRKIIKHINDKFPEGCTTFGSTLKEQEDVILKGLKDAETYGICFEADFIFYIECLIVLGIDFDKKNKSPQWANKILSDISLNGEEKMNLIHDRIIFASN